MTNKDFDNADRRFEPVKKSSTFNRILDILVLRDKKVLDLGCGYGEYLVNFGKGSLGVTSTKNEVDYGASRNIDIIRGNVELLEDLKLNRRFDAIWANNLFEHLLSPHSFLIKLKSLSHENSMLILGVPVVPRIVSLMRLGKFRGALASPHINFFTRETLKLAVEFAGWKVKYSRPFIFKNIISDTFASLFAPHIYIVAYNNKDFKYPDKKINEWKDEAHYGDLLKIAGK